MIKTQQITVAIVEHDIPESDVPCGDCVACCSCLSPHLTEQELLSNKYSYALINNHMPIPVVAIPRKPDKSCLYLIDNKCSIYNDRPLACRQFDCRKNHYPPLKDIVKQKFDIEL